MAVPDRPAADSWKIVGQSVPRREDAWLLTGKGCYVDDVPEPPNTLHLGFVLSPEAHARIVSIDADAARALPGVLDVLTGDDLAALAQPIRTGFLLEGHKDTERDVIAREKVRFVGEAVAVVVAENPYVAEDGVERVFVTYDPLPAAVGLEAVARDDAPVVHEELGTNILLESTFTTEGLDEAFAGATHVIKETFRTGRIAGVPMEPRGCLATTGRAGEELTLWTSTQIPNIVKTALAKLLDYPESGIRVITPDVGGGFGTKAHFYPEEVVCPALALKYGRPVKWIQDRREELLTNIHAREHIYAIEAGIDADGVIVAMRCDMMANAGAYSSYPFGATLEPVGGVRFVLGPYHIRNYGYLTRAVASHTCPAGAYRGTAQPTAMLAIEGMMDRIARKIGIDPAEARRRNLIQPEQLPYTTVVGMVYGTGSYTEALAKALEMIGYEDYRANQPADRLVDGKYRGIGICCYTENSGMGVAAVRARGWSTLPGFDGALVRVASDGKVKAFISHAASGQGHYTSFAQIVADQVGVPFADVSIVVGDTGQTPAGTNTFASRGTVTGGGAAIRACLVVADKMKRIAAQVLEVSADDIVLENGLAMVQGVPDMSLTVREIAEVAYSMTSHALPEGEDYGLEATDHYAAGMPTIANAVHVAAVAVDAADGTVEVERYAVVHDCGRIINPMIVDGQIHGGAVQALGEVLMEELVYDEAGQLQNATLLEYLLPTALDIPMMEIAHIESVTDENPGGFKGLGEGGVIGGVPALTNAIADALAGIGANVNSNPLKPSRITELIDGALGKT